MNAEKTNNKNKKLVEACEKQTLTEYENIM